MRTPRASAFLHGGLRVHVKNRWHTNCIQTYMWAQEKRRWIYMNLYVSNGHQKWCTSHSFIVFWNILWYRSILCIPKRWLSVAAVSCLIPLANTINAKAPGHQDVANAWPSQGLPGLAQSCFSMKPIQIFNPKSCNLFQIAVHFIISQIQEPIPVYMCASWFTLILAAERASSHRN